MIRPRRSARGTGPGTQMLLTFNDTVAFRIRDPGGTRPVPVPMRFGNSRKDCRQLFPTRITSSSKVCCRFSYGKTFVEEAFVVPALGLAAGAIPCWSTVDADPGIGFTVTVTVCG